MSKILRELEDLGRVVEQAISSLRSGQDDIGILEDLTKNVDKQFSKIVKNLGGDEWHFKKANETSLALALELD